MYRSSFDGIGHEALLGTFYCKQITRPLRIHPLRPYAGGKHSHCATVKVRREQQKSVCFRNVFD